MLYLNSQHFDALGIDWERVIDAIRDASLALGRGAFSQPIKPYLRYGDPINRIIAMPAYVGAPFHTAGIKWIASFPRNIDRNIPRAHSVTVINEHDTGKAIATMNTAVISGIRTAAVSGLIARLYQKARGLRGIRLGIVGFGPIGKLHFRMLHEILGSHIESIRIYDLRGVERNQLPPHQCKVDIVEGWREAYADADIFVTCTVADAPYIDLPPKQGSLQLNVSLRDYQPEIMQHVQRMLVDDWDETCREATDIEVMHQKYGLQKEDTYCMIDVVNSPALWNLGAEDTVMFNPMGLAVYDIAVAKLYYDLAMERGVGVMLED